MVNLRFLIRWRSVFIGVFPIILTAALEPKTNDAWVLAMGNVRVVCAPQFNAALLDSSHNRVLGLHSSEFVTGLGVWSFSSDWSQSLGGHNFRLDLSGFGDKIYQEFQVQLGTNYHPLPAVSVGLNISGSGVAIGNYASHYYAGFSLGLRLRLTASTGLGITWRNAVQTGISAGERLPEIFAFGCQMTLDRLNLAVAVEKDAQLPADLHLGLSTHTQSWWNLAIGFQSLAQCFSAGPQIRWHGWGWTYAWQWRAMIPPRQDFSLNYHF